MCDGTKLYIEHKDSQARYSIEKSYVFLPSAIQNIAPIILSIKLSWNSTRGNIIEIFFYFDMPHELCSITSFAFSFSFFFG